MSERDWTKDWEICQKATPGPWRVNTKSPIMATIAWLGGFTNFETGTTDNVWVDHCCICASDESPAIDDARFIAEARSGWPAALEERARLAERVRKLEKENVRLRKVAKMLIDAPKLQGVGDVLLVPVPRAALEEVEGYARP